MYAHVLAVHSWLRWLALVAAVGTAFAAMRGQVGGNNSIADRWGMFAVTALDLQMLLGLILYLALSPNMRPILDNFGGALTFNAATVTATVGGQLPGDDPRTLVTLG